MPCPPGRRRAPWPDVRGDADDAAFAVEEDGVDRKTHEGCVNRTGGLQQQALTLREAAATEQAAHARVRIARKCASLAHDGPVLVSELRFHRTAPLNRSY